MRIKKLSIKNFRSIKDLNLELNTMNAFIGPNNAGKSNILSAINLILGETYPTTRSFSEQDFYNRDISSPIEIKVTFDSALGTPYNNVWGFYLKAYANSGGIEVDYLPFNENGNVLVYANGTPVRVSTVMKDKALVLFLGLNRDVESQLRTQFTIYGKIIKHLNYILPQESKMQFDKMLKDSTEYLNSDDFAKFKETMQEVVKEYTGLDIDIEFEPFDPINLYRNLRFLLKESKQEIRFDAQDMGRGVQGVIALGLLLSYKKIIRDAPILLIEEPETYLHPHGCRHFYSSLRNLAQHGIQITYTTHSPFFIPLEDYKNIFLTRKPAEETIVKHITDTVPINNLKFASMFDEKLNETFFADIAVLVEGAVDKILLNRALEVGKIQPDLKNISVAECGGISEIKFLAKILCELGIKIIVLCDEDKGNPKTAIEHKEIMAVVNGENILLYDSTLEDEYKVKKLNKKEAIKTSLTFTSLEQFPRVIQNVIGKLS